MTNNWHEIDIQHIPYDDIDKELCDLIKVGNVLFNELNDANKERFQIWLDKK